MPTRETTKKSSGKKGKKVVKRKKSKVVKSTPSAKGKSKFKSAGSAAYWGYKAFQALRLCAGDITPVIELGAEIACKGLKFGASNEVVRGAVMAVVSNHGGLHKFRKSVKSFSRFSGELAAQLALRGGTQDSAIMTQADDFYRLFHEADTDGSNSISLDEFIHFCQHEGTSREDAETMFYKTDIDGSGEISFEEWTKMMTGRVGRDPETFNCAGHHGLKPHTVPVNGMDCDFCSKPMVAGSLAASCRRCDCDACGDCYRAHLPSFKDESGRFNCRGEHGLEVNVLSYPGACDWCRKHLHPGMTVVGCGACDCDGCLECTASILQEHSMSARNCRGRHGLQRMKTSMTGYGCDFCSRPLEVGASMFSCRLCEVDVCVPCMWNDHLRVLRTGRPYGCPGMHELRTFHVTSFADLGHRCDWCLGSPQVGDRMMQCGWCDVDVCSGCLASGFVPARRAPSTCAAGGGGGGGGGGLPATPSEAGSEFVGTPYHYDSLVRVIGVEDAEIDGELMTVVGYERDARDRSADLVVLQFGDEVVRELAEFVYVVLD